MNETQTEILHQSDYHHDDVAFYLDTHFWAGMSFVLAILIIAKPISKAIGSMFTKGIQNIKDHISDAKKLEADSIDILKKYEKNLKNIEKETNLIIENNNQEIAFIKTSAIEKLEKEIKIKKEETKKMLESMQIRMKGEIGNIIIKDILKTTKETLSEKLDDKNQTSLIDSSINNIKNLKA